MNPTPTPWKFTMEPGWTQTGQQIEYPCIMAGERTVCDGHLDTMRQADKDFAETAVNAHKDLVKALEAALSDLKGPQTMSKKAVIDLCEEALAKAGVRQ